MANIVAAQEKFAELILRLSWIERMKADNGDPDFAKLEKIVVEHPARRRHRPYYVKRACRFWTI